MNILFITNTLPPVVDGVGDYTLNLAKEFAKHGHHVSIVCKRDDRVATNYDDICVFPIVVTWNKTATHSVIRLIQEKHINVVSLQYVPHGYDNRGLPFAIAYLAAQIRKIDVPLYTFFHEVCIGKGKWYQIYHNIGALLMELIAKKIALNSTFVSTSIEHYKKRLNALCIDKVSLIPIPSNVPDVYTNDLEKSQLKESIACKGDTIITLFGNRDFSLVVDAIKAIRMDGTKIKVLALGKANPSIPKEDFIFFTGPMEIELLAVYLQISDILILPEDPLSGCSLKSGSLAAALQFGIPTITNSGFMTDERLSDLFLFSKENTVEEYKTLINKLINSRELADQLRNNSMAFAKHLTWKAVYDNYINSLVEFKA